MVWAFNSAFPVAIKGWQKPLAVILLALAFGFMVGSGALTISDQGPDHGPNIDLARVERRREIGEEDIERRP